MHTRLQRLALSTLGGLAALAAVALGPRPGLGAPRQDPGAARAQEPVVVPAQEPRVPPPDAKPESRTEPAPSTPPAPPAAPPAPRWEPRYHDLASIQALCESWSAGAAAQGLLCERLELGVTRGGLAAPVLRVARAGPAGVAAGAEMHQRPTLVLLGGLDGRSLTGCEAVLSVLARVFDEPAALPPGVTLLAVPWAAPDALERALGGDPDGRDLRPVDDDGDRRADEDGPEDLDGDGQILELLIEDPDGEWVRAADGRFLLPAKPGDAPRYRRAREGRDDDGDGRFNEDPPGGIALDAAFPAGFVPAGSLATGLTLPLEDEHARSLCALIATTRPVAVLALQGDHGGVAALAAGTDCERAANELVARSLAQAGMGRAHAPVPLLAELGRAPAPGSALRWMHAELACAVAEVAVWGPEIERPAGAAAGAGATGASASPAVARRSGADAPVAPPGSNGHAASNGAPPRDPRAELEQAWVRWLDDTRGGIGFVEWHPVDLGPGRKALVGGWLPFTRRNAPEAALPAALQHVPAAVLAIAGQLPRVELVFTEARRDGELVFLRARVANRGALPTSGDPAHARGSEGALGGGTPAGRAVLRARLALPTGARLVAGTEETELEPILGGTASRELAWIVIAPAQSSFELSVTLPWGGNAVGEARP